MMTREKFRLIAMALGAILLLIVFAQNLEEASVNILFIAIRMPLVILLIGTTIIGYIIGMLMAGAFKKKVVKTE